jgi:predicted  nucleic acid-binding Zn-ribbon protein
MINQVRDMADSLIFPVAGFIIVLLISLISWGAKKLFTDFDISINRVLAKLAVIETQISDVKGQINDLKTENQLQSVYIRETEQWVREQVDRLDKRIEQKREKISNNEKRIDSVERKVDKIFTFHGRNHPDDKL